MCQHDDEEAWENAIRRLLGDRAYREQMRQYGFNRTEEIYIEQVRGRQELAMKIENQTLYDTGFLGLRLYFLLGVETG